MTNDIGFDKNCDIREELLQDCRLLLEAKRLILRRRTLYPRGDWSAIKSKLSSVNRRLAVRAAQLSLLASSDERLFSKFDPNQPRIPAGQPEGGQWTSTAGGTGAPVDQHTNPGQAIVSTTAEPEFGRRAMVLAGSPFFGSPRAAVTIDYSRA